MASREPYVETLSSSRKGFDDDVCIRLIWDCDFDVADEYLKCFVKKDRIAAVRFAESSFYRFCFVGTQSVAQDGLERCNFASTMVDRRRFQGRTRASSLVADAYLAHISLMTALLQFALHNYVRGAFYLRSSWKSFANLQKKKHNGETNEDLLLAKIMCNTGVSQFLFFLSVLPNSTLFIAKLAGFESDRQEGLKLATETMNQSLDLMCKRQAAMLMILEALMRASNEFDPTHIEAQKEAIRVHNAMQEGTEDLTLIRWVGSHVWRRCDRLQDATVAMDDVMKKAARLENGPNLAFRVRFDQATMHFTEQEWDKARDAMIPLVHRSSQYTSKTMVCILLGACYGMMGKLAKSAEFYKMVNDVSLGGRMDENLKLKAKTLRRRKCQKLVGIEMTYVLGLFKALSLNDVEQALVQLMEYEKEVEIHRIVECNVAEGKKISKHMLLVDEEIVTVELLKGAYLVRLKRADEAIDCLNKCIKISNELQHELKIRGRLELYDNYHIPCAFFELAGICLSRGETQMGKQHLGRVMRRSGYTFQSGMEFRVKLIEKHIVDP
eukprot:CFRG2264T1